MKLINIYKNVISSKKNKNNKQNLLFLLEIVHLINNYNNNIQILFNSIALNVHFTFQKKVNFYIKSTVALILATIR